VLIYFPTSVLIKHFVNKSIIEKKISPEYLSILTFNISDLEKNKYNFIWKKPGKEFKFNGKMYDIENYNVKGDSVYYNVYYDHKENILEELFSLQQKDNKKDKSQNTVQRVLLAGLYFEHTKYLAFNINMVNKSNLPLDKNGADFLNHITDVPSPPPRKIV
ncbi:MAG: hypothetical protein Q8M94_14835, partial [Ignavibacteria bacterium]|nr:hypothetical protein [Ignavibacteria bacterium]